MAAQTGRTTNKYVSLHIDDSGGTLREITGVKSINGVGITYAPMDTTALADALTRSLPGRGTTDITIVGHLDNTADTGFHTVFSGINGGVTPLAFDVRIGMRQTYTTGEPQFGVTGSASDGYLCDSYVVDISSMEATATLKLYGGTPAWGTAVES